MTSPRRFARWPLGGAALLVLTTKKPNWLGGPELASRCSPGSRVPSASFFDDSRYAIPESRAITVITIANFRTVRIVAL